MNMYSLTVSVGQEFGSRLAGLESVMMLLSGCGAQHSHLMAGLGPGGSASKMIHWAVGRTSVLPTGTTP